MDKDLKAIIHAAILVIVGILIAVLICGFNTPEMKDWVNRYVLTLCLVYILQIKYNQR